MKNIFMIGVVFCVCGVLVPDLFSAQQRGDESAIVGNNQIKSISARLEMVEERQNSEKDLTKQALSISSDTVKYVGTIASWIFPLLLFILGFQVVRGYQFEKEIKETRKCMEMELEKMTNIRESSEKLSEITKSKIKSLEELVAGLTTDYLKKTSSNIVADMREQTRQVLNEIKTKDEEMARGIELMKKVEALDLTLTPSIYLERAGVYASQGNQDKALENYDAAIKMQPNNSDAYFHKGYLYSGLRKWDLAVANYTKSLEINPKQPLACVNIGACYASEKKYDLAIQYATKALELSPNFLFALEVRARVYTSMGKYDLALKDLEQGMKFYPRSAEINLAYGLYYEALKEHKKAIAHFTEVVKVNASLEIKQNIVEEYICIQDYENAEKWANECVITSKTATEKIFSKFLLSVVYILSKKESDSEVRSMTELLNATPDFNSENWSFSLLLGCLENAGISGEQKEAVLKLIKLLRREV